MFLTAANVFHYLLEKRFAAAEDVVDNRFTVHALSRRNLNFHVAAGAREYLVKQVRKWDPDGRISIEREASVYWQARTNPSLAPVAALAPECYAWDPIHAILIIEYLPGHSEIYDLADRFDPHLARIAGRAMGAFHRAMHSADYMELFPEETPWHLSMHETGEDDIAELSAGRRELIRAVRRHPEFGEALQGLRAEWAATAVIQGDWKLDNCLVPAERDRVRLVDWEFACWGDPAWDLASMLQSYWNFWITSPEDQGIEEIRPALRALLEGYGDDRTARKALRFAGARMLQTAFEHLERADRMTPAAVRLLQGSLTILSRPDWAADQLLGAA